jgi:hypothetical protein
MDESLRQAIIGHLNSTVDIVLERVRDKARLFFNSEIISLGNGTASPFSKILFPQIKLASLVERSFSASIGTTFNYIARELTRNAYGNGELEYLVEGELPDPIIALIDTIVDRYRGEAHRSPNTLAELQEIRNAFSALGGDEVVPTSRRRLKSDVFFIDHNGIENYIEIKTPMPNYDTCKAVKIRILLINAIRHPEDVLAKAAFPHNPNGVMGDYAWPPTRYFLDTNLDWAVNGTPLMGEGLWNYLGDSPTTFTDILGCCEHVFRDRGSDVTEVLDAVAFGVEEL